MYHTKKIGIFISHIFGEYQRDLCQGITDRGAEYGFITEIFTSTDGEDLGAYSQGETSILRIPNFNQFTGVVVATDTYLQKDLATQILHTLQEKCTCPVLEISQRDSLFPALCLDNDFCTTNLATHLIETHHCKRICYLGCSLETYFSDHRRVLWEQALLDHNMSADAADTCDCTYETESVEKALDFLLQKETAPDAIICYNDRIAVLLMELIQKKGFRIPEDICVTGFDDLEASRYTVPELTTVTFPVYEMGARAFDLLLEASASQTPLPPFSTVEAMPIYRASCCLSKKKKERNPLPFQNSLMQKLRDAETSMLEDIKLSANLHGINDLEEGMDLLEEYVSSIENCREFYICLFPDWNHIPGHIRRITSMPEDYEDTDTLLMPFAFRDGIRLPGCSFTRKNILPDYLYSKSGSSYIFAPLFFKEREFGYAVFSFEAGQVSARFNLLTFLRNINTLLKHLHDLRQTGLLVNRLEDVSGKDELTDLPNRHGFRVAARALLKQAAAKGSQVLSMQFFLADMPEITGRYGRAERDLCICVVGHALESAVGETDCISHQGGGEFLLLTPDTQKADVIEGRISNYLNNYNRLHTKPYDITISSIRNIAPVTEGTQIEDLFL